MQAQAQSPNQTKILLLPGAGGMNAPFKSFCERCSAQMPAILLDYPDWLWQIKNPGIEQLSAEMAKRVQASAGADAVALAGYSLGAHIAVRIAQLCRGAPTEIAWIAALDPVMPVSTGLGANLLSRLSASLSTALQAGPRALARHLWVLLNRAVARLLLPMFLKFDPGLLIRIAPIIPATSLMARELKLRIMIAAGVAASREPNIFPPTPHTVCHVIKIEDAPADTAFWQAHFEHVVFENISGTHHNMIDNPELVMHLRRWSYSGETPT
jgi:pimeloyl-ACP methyl ester carboxylesterase